MGNSLLPDLANPKPGDALRSFEAFFDAYAPTDLKWIWPHRNYVGWPGLADYDYAQNRSSFLLPDYQWRALETVVIVSADYTLRSFERQPPDPWDRKQRTADLCNEMAGHLHLLELLATRSDWEDGIECLGLGARDHFDRFCKEIKQCAGCLSSQHHRSLVDLVLGVLSLQADPKCRSFHLPSQVADAQELHFKKLEQHRERLMEQKAAALNARLRQGRT